MMNSYKQTEVVSEENTFLDENQLSLRWHVSTKMLQQSRWKGKGCKYVKIGRMVRYRLSDVKQYECARTISQEQ